MKISSSACDYNSVKKQLVRAFNYKFPDYVDVESSRTKKTVRFLPVSYGDDLFDEDGWDGEQMIYRASSPEVCEVTLVLYHSF